MMFDELIQEEESRFTVTDDQKAMWCVRKIKEAQEEADRFTRFYQAQIKHTQEQANGTIAYMTSLLEPYFDTLPRRKTKTQETYALPGAKLVRKAQDPAYARDPEKLLAFLKAAGRTDCIKTKEEASWSDYKPLTTILDGKVVDTETGEIVAGVTVEERGPKFEVKIDG